MERWGKGMGQHIQLEKCNNKETPLISRLRFYTNLISLNVFSGQPILLSNPNEP